MLGHLTDWCARAGQTLRSRYVRVIEEELVRARGEIERLREEIAALRAENRAVVNSLLGTAGVPPIETPRAATTTAAVRRRSWPQIATTREIEAARAERVSRGRLRDGVAGKGSFGDGELQPAPERDVER